MCEPRSMTLYNNKTESHPSASHGREAPCADSQCSLLGSCEFRVQVEYTSMPPGPEKAVGNTSSQMLPHYWLASGHSKDWTQ